jgi:hypothetical protein
MAAVTVLVAVAITETLLTVLFRNVGVLRYQGVCG